MNKQTTSIDCVSWGGCRPGEATMAFTTLGVFSTGLDESFEVSVFIFCRRTIGMGGLLNFRVDVTLSDFWTFFEEEECGVADKCLAFSLVAWLFNLCFFLFLVLSFGGDSLSE